jgi:hypothetical protein
VEAGHLVSHSIEINSIAIISIKDASKSEIIIIYHFPDAV